MFGLNEALMSFIRRQVGLRTDAPDAGGSLHGKVGALNNETAKIPKFGFPVSSSSFSSSSATMVTAYNYFGKGIIYIAGEPPQYTSGTGTVYMKVTADGVNVGELAFKTRMGYGVGDNLVGIEYKNSIKIECKFEQPPSTGGVLGTVGWINFSRS